MCINCGPTFGCLVGCFTNPEGREATEDEKRIFEELKSRPTSEGHELSRRQIAKHGKDRYPTAGAQYGKTLDELGELGEALIGGDCADAVKAEYADAGLALYALGDKLGIDLIEAMRELVNADERKFG